MLAERGVVRGHTVAAIGELHRRLTKPWTLSSLAAEVHLSCSQRSEHSTPQSG
jgi:hypothetical protein